MLRRQGVGGCWGSVGRLSRQELTRQEGRRHAAAQPAAACRARGHAARRLGRLPQAPGEAPCLAELKEGCRPGQCPAVLQTAPRHCAQAVAFHACTVHLPDSIFHLDRPSARNVAACRSGKEMRCFSLSVCPHSGLRGDHGRETCNLQFQPQLCRQSTWLNAYAEEQCYAMLQTRGFMMPCRARPKLRGGRAGRALRPRRRRPPPHKMTGASGEVSSACWAVQRMLCAR